MSRDFSDLQTRTTASGRPERRRFAGRASFEGMLHPAPVRTAGGMPHPEDDRATAERTDDHRQDGSHRPRHPADAAHPLFTADQDRYYEEGVRRGDILPDDWASTRRRDTTTSVVRAPSTTTASQPPVSTTSAPSVPARRSKALPVPPLEEEETTRVPRRLPWKRAVGALVVGAVVMSALVVSLNAASNWWQGVQADWSYGYPRVSQIDAVVGHDHDSAAHPSHFLVLNLHGQLDIIEIPAGNPTDARLYTGPTLTGPQADREVATVSFQDVNHDGRPDLVLHVGSTAFVLLNGTDGKFHQPSQQPPQGQ